MGIFRVWRVAVAHAQMDWVARPNSLALKHFETLLAQAIVDFLNLTGGASR
jgi:hypothetical protein